MEKKHCPLENEVTKALREEKINGELRKHMAGCPVCRDIALVQGWMKRFQESAWNTGMPEKALPDAERIWNLAHARIRPDKKLVRKALRPLIFPQVLFYGLVIAGIIYTTIWGFERFGHILDNRMTSMILPFFGIMMFIVVISLSFCAIVAAFDKRKHPI